MRRLRVRNRSRDVDLGDRVALADGLLTRLRGMIGRPEPAAGEGMLIAPSQGVHMWWMKYPLDVALLDRGGEVVATYPGLQPGRRTRIHRQARYALELPAGVLMATGTEIGDLLEWDVDGSPASVNETEKEG